MQVLVHGSERSLFFQFISVRFVSVLSLSMASGCHEDIDVSYGSFRIQGPGVEEMSFSESIDLGIIEVSDGVGANDRCAATLLTNSWLATALHCFDDLFETPSAPVSSINVFVPGGFFGDADVFTFLPTAEPSAGTLDLAFIHVDTPIAVGGSAFGFRQKLYDAPETWLDGSQATCFGGRGVPALGYYDFDVSLQGSSAVLELEPEVDFGPGDSGGPCFSQIPGHGGALSMVISGESGASGIVIGPEQLMALSDQVNFGEEQGPAVVTAGVARTTVLFTNTGAQPLCRAMNVVAPIFSVEADPGELSSFMLGNSVQTNALGSQGIGFFEATTECSLESGGTTRYNSGTTVVLSAGLIPVLLG